MRSRRQPRHFQFRCHWDRMGFILFSMVLVTGSKSYALLDDYVVDHDEIEKIYQECADHSQSQRCFRTRLKEVLGQEPTDDDRILSAEELEENNPPAPEIEPINIRGSIEKQSFNFNVESRADFYNQCISFYNRTGYNKVDNISVSTNFRSVVEDYKSTGYWENSMMVCASIYRLIQRDYGDLPQLEQEGFDVIFYIEKRSSPVYINVKSEDEFIKYCTSFYNKTGYNKVDNIGISRNLNNLQERYKSTGYWESAFSVCQNLLELSRR